MSDPYVPGTTTLEGTRYPQNIEHVLMDMREDARRIWGTWETFEFGEIVSAYELTYDMPDGHYTANEMATTEEEAEGQARDRNEIPFWMAVDVHVLENLYATHEIPD
jgi:hypothetical protein